ncbi:MAG: rRNA adenine dimethyltransferase family protein, partial [Candidatus Binatia bacterium]
MSLAAETRALLQREGLAPRKSLGQHFLVDSRVIARMADLAEVTKRDAVLEIGPGVGALTDVLAERAARLYIVEYDRGLSVVLRRKFASNPEVKVIEGDALEVDLRGEVPETEVKVVASLPYNISVPILF